MTDLGRILVQLLKEIDDICRKNDIRYYILGGTTIGQIRHGGLIPWDDDIDLTMPRADFEKFESIIGDCMPEGRELFTVNRFPTYTSPIARYTDLTTTAVRSGRIGDQTPCGECIEIFILDPLPKAREEEKRWKALQYVYCELLCTGWIQAKRKNNRDCIDVALYEEYAKRCKDIGRIAVLKELEKEIFSIDEKDAELCSLRWTPRGSYVFPIRCFGEPVDVVYEGLTVMGPSRPQEYLQCYLGYSWRNILAPDERGIHPTRINHTLHSGNCEREGAKLMSVDEINKKLESFKKNSMEYYKLRTEHYQEQLTPMFKYVELKTNRLVEKYGIDRIREDSDLALEVFGEYLRQQRNGLLRNNRVLLPLKDEYIDILVEVMFEKGMIQQLFEVLHIRHKNLDSMSKKQEELYRAAKDFLKMVVHLDLEENEEAEKIWNKYIAVYPDHVWLYRCRAELDYRRALVKSDYNTLLRSLEVALSKHPSDDLLNKRYADALEKIGRKEEAVALYKKVAQNTINGLLLYEMKKYGIEEAALRLDGVIW